MALGCAGWWWGPLGLPSRTPVLPPMHLAAHKKAVVHSCPVGEPQGTVWGATIGSHPPAHPLLGRPPSTFSPRGRQTRGGFALKDSLQTGTGLSGGGVVGKPFCLFVRQYKGDFPPGPRSPGPQGRAVGRLFQAQPAWLQSPAVLNKRVGVWVCGYCFFVSKNNCNPPLQKYLFFSSRGKPAPSPLSLHTMCAALPSSRPCLRAGMRPGRRIFFFFFFAIIFYFISTAHFGSSSPNSLISPAVSLPGRKPLLAQLGARRTRGRPGAPPCSCQI